MYTETVAMDSGYSTAAGIEAPAGGWYNGPNGLTWDYSLTASSVEIPGGYWTYDVEFGWNFIGSD